MGGVGRGAEEWNQVQKVVVVTDIKEGVDRFHQLLANYLQIYAYIRELTLDRCLWAETPTSGRFVQNSPLSLLYLFKRQDFNLGVTLMSSRASSREDFLTGGKPEEKPNQANQYQHRLHVNAAWPGEATAVLRTFPKQKQAFKPRPKNSTT